MIEKAGSREGARFFCARKKVKKVTVTFLGKLFVEKVTVTFFGGELREVRKREKSERVTVTFFT